MLSPMGNGRPVRFTGFIFTIATAIAAACGPATKRESPAPASDAEEPAVADAAAPTATDPLGLAPGATWTFRGTWTRWDDAAGDDVTTPLTWTTTILSVESQGDALVYEIEGWPGDAPDQPRRRSRLIVPAAGAGAVRFADAGPWLTLPIADGAEQCDGAYCWRVESQGRGWDVVLRTGPDVTVVHLEPGRGVTRYEYHHNGTTDDVVLERAD